MCIQSLLFNDFDINDKVSEKKEYIVNSFSYNGLCSEKARQELEKKYEGILEVTNKFDRRSVSYQMSKKDVLHSWLKYKEGFSANLVNTLLDEMKAKPGDLIMDPFMGSGTTALVCKMRGINSIGYDILPLSSISIKVKKNIFKYDINEIRQLIREFSSLKMPDNYYRKTPYIKITETAYPEYNERFIQYISDWIEQSNYSSEVKNLFTLCVVNSLEKCSYTSKDGQYLRWDSRASKILLANAERCKMGRQPLPKHQCRKTIENISDAVKEELNRILTDIIMLQFSKNTDIKANIDFKQKSVLFELPLIANNTLNGVITSPPYCNRYDYTRTYALELVYLGLGEKEIKELRQSLLTCTVESKTKIDILHDFYKHIGASERFDSIYNKIKSNLVFQEIIQALKIRKDNGDLNNNGILRMVEGYFTELAFIYAELYRICKLGASVAFVNDIVRYGGEVIPVDYLSTSFAEQFGFSPIKVYCIKQQKGNSSQQMKKYGRVPLRKSITIWKKE